MSGTIICKSLEQLEDIADQLIGMYPETRIFAFYGAMGAGKTTFIKTLCRQLGVIDEVNSPTFAIINEYLMQDGEPVYHFDLYRLKSWKEMLDLGYEDYFYSGHYCLLEWPEMIENLLPEEAVAVRIDAGNDGVTRTFTF